MPNIPGISRRVQPNVFTETRTRQRVNAVGGGIRVPAIIGEGLSEEIVITAANGGGADGVNPDFSGNNAPDGRHFELASADLVANRTEITKNGLPLNVLESTISSSTFDSRFDVRLDIATGRFQLQQAFLKDVGSDGATTQYYTPNQNNTGNPTLGITSASLLSQNAPAETWTLRCVSVVKDSLGAVIPGNATLSLVGSVSGAPKDGYGNSITWKSDGTVYSNGILSFAVTEGGTALDVGDRFTITVDSGVLSAGDEIVAKYISNSDLYDPEVFTDSAALFTKHGQPSASNTLSLGAQMAFENGAPAVICMQAKPTVPRKTSTNLLAADNPLTAAVEGATGNTDIPDTIFPLSTGALPDADTDVSIFITSSDGSEEQLVLTKAPFYNESWGTIVDGYTGFVNGATSNSYTVISAYETEQSGDDGYHYHVPADGYYFQSASLTLLADRVDSAETDIGKKIIFFNESGARARYTITEIGDGYGATNIAKVTFDGSAGDDAALTGNNLRWQLYDENDTSAHLALTDDVVAANLTAGKGLRISFVDNKDADFFDTNWTAAYEALELVDARMVVPLPLQTPTAVFKAGKAHVETMSNIVNARERVLIIGALTGLTPDNLLGTSDAAVEDIGVLEGIQGDDAEEVLAGNIEDLANYSVAAAFGDSFRVIYMAPDLIIRNIAGTNTELPGYFQAPALAGFLAGQTNIAVPPTFKSLAGYSIPRSRRYRPLQKDALSGGGVLLVDANGTRMLHGITTTQSRAPEEEEISIVLIRDEISRSMRESLRPFIGSVNSSTTVSEISNGVDKLLRAYTSQGLLNGFSNLSVARDFQDKRQVNIKVDIAPAGPLNWVYAEITVSL